MPCDTVHKLYQGILYPQNATQFHSTQINLISFTTTRKYTDFLAPNFIKLINAHRHDMETSQGVCYPRLSCYFILLMLRPICEHLPVSSIALNLTGRFCLHPAQSPSQIWVPWMYRAGWDRLWCQSHCQNSTPQLSLHDLWTCSAGNVMSRVHIS